MTKDKSHYRHRSSLCGYSSEEKRLIGSIKPESKRLRHPVTIGLFVILIVAIAIAASIILYQQALTGNNLTKTVTFTTMTTVTHRQSTSSTSNIPVVTNGTSSVQFLGFGLNGTTVYSPVKNVGNSSLSIKYVIVNGVTAYFNGSSNSTHMGLLTVTQNPIPPNEVSTIAVTSMLNACYAPCSYTFTLVTEQGVMLTHYDYFVGGISTTTTTNITTTNTFSRTIEYRTFTGKTVAIDPSLQVQMIQSILITGNATQIAQRLASAFNELPVTLVSEQLPYGPNNTKNAFQATYNYRTSKDSRIGITFTYLNNQFQFYQLGYTVKDYTNLTSVTVPNNPSFNTNKAGQSAEQIMSDLGIPFAQVTLVNRKPSYISTTDYAVEWVQGYKGTPLSGTLVTDWGGSRITVTSTLELEFYPPTGELIGISMFGPYWYLIPANFPLNVQASTAISTVVSMANSQLNMSQLTYTNAAFVAIQGHLYYVISVGNGIIEYLIYINPRTGEAGFPQP